MLFRCGIKGASMARMVDQSTPAKKGCSLISDAPLRPRRVSDEVRNLCGDERKERGCERHEA